MQITNKFLYLSLARNKDITPCYGIFACSHAACRLDLEKSKYM